MADKKFTELTADTAPSGDDLVASVDAPGGSAASKKVTVQALVGYLVTTAGDILYATAARTLARLGIGTAGQVLAVNAGATAPAWANAQAADGWTPDTATWTYASATTFTVATDVTAQFRKGTKLKLTQTTAKYFYVTLSSYGAPNTTVTVTGGTDYTLANAAITSPYYSYAECPQAFPDWFNWTPTLSTSGSMTWTTTTVYIAKFKISGRAFSAIIYARGTTGGTASNYLLATLPFTLGNAYGIAAGRAEESDVEKACGPTVINSNQVRVSLEDGANWGLATATGFHIMILGEI